MNVAIWDVAARLAQPAQPLAKHAAMQMLKQDAEHRRHYRNTAAPLPALNWQTANE